MKRKVTTARIMAIFIAAALFLIISRFYLPYRRLHREEK